MRDPKDYQAIKVCPYCGDEYGSRIQCCGEHHGHATWVTDCPGLEEMQFDTEADCAKAIEDAVLCMLLDKVDNLRKAAKGG